MNLNIKYLNDLEVVEIFVNGQVDHEKRKEIFCASQASLCAYGCKKLLINKIESTRFFDQSMTGALSLVNLISALPFPENAWIAVVSKQVEQYDMLFATVADVKGISINNFTRRDHALEWLCGSWGE